MNKTCSRAELRTKPGTAGRQNIHHQQEADSRSVQDLSKANATRVFNLSSICLNILIENYKSYLLIKPQKWCMNSFIRSVSVQCRFGSTHPVHEVSSGPRWSADCTHQDLKDKRQLVSVLHAYSDMSNWIAAELLTFWGQIKQMCTFKTGSGYVLSQISLIPDGFNVCFQRESTTASIRLNTEPVCHAELRPPYSEDTISPLCFPVV